MCSKLVIKIRRFRGFSITEEEFVVATGNAWKHLSLYFIGTVQENLRIRYVYPGSRIRIFFYPGSEFFPDTGSASKNFSILTQKIVSKLSEIWSGLFTPDTDPDFYPSRIQGSKRHRIPVPDSQHCVQTREAARTTPIRNTAEWRVCVSVVWWPPATRTRWRWWQVCRRIWPSWTVPGSAETS